MSYWASKQAHQFPHFGWYIQKLGADNRIHFDNFDVCKDISKTDGSRMLIKFGNEFGHPLKAPPFQHPNTCPHDNWYHWDNPELPQFLWPLGHNPSGAKDWVRWVKGGLLTQGSYSDDVPTHVKRINKLLRETSGQLIYTWQDIVQIQKPQHDLRKVALICPVTAPNFVHYYSTTQQDWINKVTKVLERQGYTWEVRHKPGRGARVGNQLIDQLSGGKYGITVSQHSVAAMESAIAGIPPVVTGPHPTGMLGTPWTEFEYGHVRPISKKDVENQCLRLLANIRHKKELFTGAWNA
jgi:hypothetical protein